MTEKLELSVGVLRLPDGRSEVVSISLPGHTDSMARTLFGVDPSGADGWSVLHELPDELVLEGKIDGPLPDWLFDDRPIYARKPLTPAEWAVLFGEDRPPRVSDRGLLPENRVVPTTESDSRQRRRWLARKGRR